MSDQPSPFHPSGSDPAHVSDMVSAIMKAQIRMMDSVLRQNIEALDFMKTRFEKDRALLDELATSQDPAEAMKLVQSFWTRTMTDYADEAGKMGALSAATAEQIVEGLTAEARALAGGAPREGQEDQA
ncbi:MAG: phasin family protein [Rubellimicrobium sp.]|nr:phasin family protein [Rubellimicrobium sp.]